MTGRGGLQLRTQEEGVVSPDHYSMRERKEAAGDVCVCVCVCVCRRDCSSSKTLVGACVSGGIGVRVRKNLDCRTRGCRRLRSQRWGLSPGAAAPRVCCKGRWGPRLCPGKLL